MTSSVRCAHDVPRFAVRAAHATLTQSILPSCRPWSHCCWQSKQP